MEKEYYKQPYHEPESQVPNPSFSEIMKDFFFAPFQWNARSTRKEFWISYAVQVVISIIIGTIELLAILPYSSIDTNDTEWNEVVSSITITFIIINIILSILLLWLKFNLLGAAIRRLHDTNHEGWWILLYLVPFGWIFIIYFIILPTVEEPVRWGNYLFTK